MEHLMTFLSTIIDKHLITSMISIIVTILVYSITPADNSILFSVGSTFFLILIFCITFLIVKFLMVLFRWVNKKRYAFSNKKEKAEYVGMDFRNKLEQTWTYIDSLTPSERKLIEKFIESDNKPYVENGNVYHTFDAFLNSDLIHKRQMYRDSNDSIEYVTSVNIHNMFENNNLYSEYVLNDDFYKLLKYSKEKYGKISHFD